MSRSTSRSDGTSVALGALALVLPLALATPARAQDAGDVDCSLVSDFPCRYQIEALRLQKVPAVLKFQARVSQAKLPLGRGRFATVVVKVLRGTDVLCSEALSDVLVEGGIVNLDIGRGMDCELDEVLAENDGLAFQICPGGAESCLPPVSLAATPYAMKASFASVARRADRANLAGQASYAHRMTADRDMLTRQTLGAGYFDFFTPSAAQAAELYPDAAAFAPEARGGFVSWTPTRDPEALHLHVVGKQHGTDRLVELDSLALVSEDTLATGDLTVTPSPDGAGLVVSARGVHVTGDSDVAGPLAVTRALTVASEGAHVTGDSEVAGELVVGGRTTVQAGGAHVDGDSDVAGALTVSQILSVLSGGAHVGGATDIDGTLLVHGAAIVASGGAHVTGDAAVSGGLAVDAGARVGAGGVTVQAGGLRVSSGGAALGAGDLAVTGDARFIGRLRAHDLELAGPVRAVDALGRSHRFFALAGATLGVNPDASLDATEFAGRVRFTGPVFFDAGTVDPDQAERYVLARGESRDLVFSGALTVVDALSAPAGFTGGLDVSGGATVYGALALPDGVSGPLAIGGGLTVAGAATFAGGLALPGGVAGALDVTGGITASGLAVSGPATFAGAVTLAGGVGGAVAFSGRVTLPAGKSLSVAGPTTLAALTLEGALQANGATRFDGPVTLASGLAGNTTFRGDVAVAGVTVLSGPTAFASGLVVDGATRFNGSVSFGGAFTGTTSFQNIAATGNLTVAGASTFSGPVSFPGGITGSATLGAVAVGTGLTVAGWTVVRGPATLAGAVTGLDNLPTYIKATGETRGVSLGGGLAVAGNVSVQGTLTLAGGLVDLEVAHLRVATNVNIAGSADFDDTKVDGDILVGDRFAAPGCRVCLNYSDNLGDDVGDRKHACVRLQDGQSSGMMGLSGDVNDDDVFAIVYVCDGGPSENGSGWVY